MCLLRCTTRHAKLGHAKKTFQPMHPKHWAEQRDHLGPATNLRVQKHNWERKLQIDAGKKLTDPLAGGGCRDPVAITGPWLLQQKYCQGEIS